MISRISNAITKPISQETTSNDKDPFRVSHENGGPVAVGAVQSPDRLLQDAWGRFRDRIKQAVKLGGTEKDGIR
jgi:hypothetical protein